jgi:ribosomal protein S18 acetylase RimI-like enzyme
MTDQVGFRDATAADLAAVVRLLADDDLGRTRERVEDPLPEAYVAAFRAIDDDPNHRLVVIERAGEVMGCLQLTFIPGISFQGGWRMQIEGVRIARALRGQGAGERVLRWAIDLARERGCRMVQLTTNRARPDALRFYERLGFTHSHAGLKLDLAP